MENVGPLAAVENVRMTAVNFLSAMPRLLLVLIPAVWVVAIAILSVQNATPVAIKFLTFQSVALPFGVVLSFCAAGGMVATALLLLLLGGRKRLQR
jgi:uncharacterized integral membrane protein